MILDASVALKWLLDEADSDAARSLAPRQDLAAPSMLRVEVGYLLTKRLRQRFITEMGVREAWSDLEGASLRYADDALLLDRALELSLQLSANFYDCVYLSQAIGEGDVLVTADERFARSVRTAPELAAYVQTLAEATA